MESFLEWLGTAEFAIRLLGWTGLPKWAQQQLAAKRGVIMTPAFQFFPTRDLLEKSRPLEDIFRESSKTYCIHATGRRIWLKQFDGINKIEKVILPNPQSASFNDYAKSVGEARGLIVSVCEATKNIKEKSRAQILWYPEMIHVSINIADPEEIRGWVHIEQTLPFSTPNLRPSYTIYRREKHHEQTVIDYWQVFNKLWHASKEPDWEYVEKQTKSE